MWSSEAVNRVDIIDKTRVYAYKWWLVSNMAICDVNYQYATLMELHVEPYYHNSLLWCKSLML